MRVRQSLLAAILLAVCAAAQVATTSKPTEGKATPTDEQLEREVHRRFSNSKIAKNNFKVHVQNGVVTLDGQTDIVQHKGAATRMARTAGARSVVNRIVISESGKRKAAADRKRDPNRSEPRRVTPRTPKSRGQER